jgi:hypothetical protein
MAYNNTHQGKRVAFHPRLPFGPDLKEQNMTTVNYFFPAQDAIELSIKNDEVIYVDCHGLDMVDCYHSSLVIRMDDDADATYKDNVVEVRGTFNGAKVRINIVNCD